MRPQFAKQAISATNPQLRTLELGMKQAFAALQIDRFRRLHAYARVVQTFPRPTKICAQTGSANKYMELVQ